MNEHPRVNRRTFLKATVGGTALIASAWTGARAAVSGKSLAANPFAYDTAGLGRIPPDLLQYELTGSFRSPHADPKRLAIGSDDRLYIAAGKYISVLDREGNLLSEIATASPPRCLAASGEGLIYAGLRDHVDVYDAKGQKRASWDTVGPRAWLTGLALSENELFATDAGARVVLRYDRAGKLLGRIGQKDTERNIPGFVVPSPYFDVKLPKDGLLRVTNPGRHRVEAYTVEGDLEFAWGKASAAIDGFCGCCNPISLALFPDGRYLTCEKGLPRVKVFDPHGSLAAVVAGPSQFAESARVSAGATAADATLGGLDAVIDSRERVYVLDLVTTKVQIFTRKPGSKPNA